MSQSSTEYSDSIGTLETRLSQKPHSTPYLTNRRRRIAAIGIKATQYALENTEADVALLQHGQEGKFLAVSDRFIPNLLETYRLAEHMYECRPGTLSVRSPSSLSVEYNQILTWSVRTPNSYIAKRCREGYLGPNIVFDQSLLTPDSAL